MEDLDPNQHLVGNLMLRTHKETYKASCVDLSSNRLRQRETSSGFGASAVVQCMEA